MQSKVILVIGRYKEVSVQIGKSLSRNGFIVHIRDYAYYENFDNTDTFKPDFIFFHEIFGEKHREEIIGSCERFPDIDFIFTSCYQDFRLERIINSRENSLFLLWPIDFPALAQALQLPR